MDLLWSSSAPLSVADVHSLLSAERELAYTTVMTVLDRLSKKGLVDRELVSRAWQYRAHSSQAEVVAREVCGLLSGVKPEVRAEALRLVSMHLTDDEREVDGVSLSGGLTTHDEIEAKTNGAMMERSQRVIIAVDSSKLGVVTLAKMGDLASVDVLVTDSAGDPWVLDRLRDAGLEIRLV